MYGTVDHLIARYGSQQILDLTDRASPASNQIDRDLITAELTAASAMVDGYLAGRYTLPLATVPDLVATLTEAIAFYRLHTHTAPEKTERDYTDALATLRDLSKGVARLPAQADAAAPAPTSGAVFIECARPFTQSSMKGFI